MKTSILLIAVSAGAALAQPSSFVKRDSLCPDVLYSVAQCCSPNVLNSVMSDCKTPSSANDIADFKASCNSAGTPQCCAVAGATEAVLCTDAVGA